MLSVFSRSKYNYTYTYYKPYIVYYGYIKFVARKAFLGVAMAPGLCVTNNSGPLLSFYYYTIYALCVTHARGSRVGSKVRISWLLLQVFHIYIILL